LHVARLFDIVLTKILNVKGVYISWDFFFGMMKDNLGRINVIILLFSERNNECFFYFVKVSYACPSLFHLCGFFCWQGELRNLYIYNKNMNIFSRRVAIGGDEGVNYPKECALLNNFLLLNEKYYLSHWVYIYFIRFHIF